MAQHVKDHLNGTPGFSLFLAPDTKNTCPVKRQVCPQGGNLPRPLRQSTGLSQAGRNRRHIKFWGVRHGLFDSRTGHRVSRFFLAPDTKKHLPFCKTGVCLSLPAGRESPAPFETVHRTVSSRTGPPATPRPARAVRFPYGSPGLSLFSGSGYKKTPALLQGRCLVKRQPANPNRRLQKLHPSSRFANLFCNYR